MLTVDDYGRIRRAYRDGMSIREIARAFRHGRVAIREALLSPEPKGYTRRKPPDAPKLGPFKGVIEGILTADEAAPGKQRHTAMQIYRRLCSEHSYEGGYDQVRRYVKQVRKRRRETFIPLHPRPGERLDADFGHVHVDFPWGREQVPVLLLTWGYSNAPFALPAPTERAEAVLAGMVEGFEFFGAVPREVWWDNPKTVATAIHKGRKRTLHDRYAALASHYAFDPLFCMPRRGQEKSRVENRVYDLQRRWCTPVPRFQDRAEFAAYLQQCCLEERKRTVQGQTETIGARFEADLQAAASLPAHRFDPCVPEYPTADKYQTVPFDSNRYSVPRSCAFERLTVKGYIDEVVVVAKGQEVARHPRHYGKREQILDPLHYVAALERRPAALDHSDLYRNWQLPPAFLQAREELEGRYGKSAGARQYVRILQLLYKHPKERVAEAIVSSFQKGNISAQAVASQADRLAGLSDSGQSRLFLDTESMRVEVPKPDLRNYDRLLGTGDGAHGDNEQDRPASESQPEAASPADDQCRVCPIGA